MLTKSSVFDMLNQQVASETSITAIQRSTVGKLLIPKLLRSPLFVGTNCADPHPGKNSLVTVLPPTSQQKARRVSVAKHPANLRAV